MLCGQRCLRELRTE